MIDARRFLEHRQAEIIVGSDGVLRYEDADLRSRIAVAMQEVESPSESQKKVGNWRKGHVTIQGLPITIEYAKGSIRTGKSKDGRTWSREMQSAYGYIKRTKGADSDNIDVFIGPHPESEIVFVIDQVKESGRMDEHKAMLGYTNEREARDGYLANYPDGWKGLGAIKSLRMVEFKEWIRDGDTGQRIEDQRFMYMVDAYGHLISDLISQRETQALAKAQMQGNERAAAKHQKRWADEIRRKIALRHLLIDYDYAYAEIAPEVFADLHADSKPPDVEASWERNIDDFLALYEDRFITIGGRQEGDKKHAGGTVIKISSEGKIEAGGPPALRGTNIKDAKTNFDKLDADKKPTSEPAKPTSPVSKEGRLSPDALREKMRAKQGPKPEEAKASPEKPLVNDQGKMDSPAVVQEPAPAVQTPQHTNMPWFAETEEDRQLIEKHAPKELKAWQDAYHARLAIGKDEGGMDERQKFRKSTLEPAYNALRAAHTKAKQNTLVSPEGKWSVPIPDPAPKPKQFGKPQAKEKSHAEKKMKLKHDAAKDRTGDTLYKIVSRMGGINRESVKALGLDLDNLMESHLTGLFPRQGGASLEDIAEELQNEGHVHIPGIEYHGDPNDHHTYTTLPKDAGEFVMNKLLDRAKSLHANADAEYKQSYERFIREQQSAAAAGFDPSEIASVIRRGEEDGTSESAQGDAWEGDSVVASEATPSEVESDVPFEDDVRLLLYSHREAA